MRTTNRYLQNTYAEFNRKYFGNKLPKDMVVRFGETGDAVAVTDCKYDRPLYIIINRKTAWHHMIVDATLLHEMVHVENPKPNGHGPWFQKRMLKLAKKGAFKHVW